jgi:hypothetical protein
LIERDAPVRRRPRLVELPCFFEALVAATQTGESFVWVPPSSIKALSGMEVGVDSVCSPKKCPKGSLFNGFCVIMPPR